METEIKYFTPLEANRTLPLVRKIVDDILVEGRELRALLQEEERTAELEERIDSRKEKILVYIEELSEIGCYYKDWNFELGLIDFPAMLDGEEVLLCWRSDEPSITWYHGLNDGFRGRRKIPEKYLV